MTGTLDNKTIPQGWTLIKANVQHPTKDFRGDLMRENHHGRYAIFSCGYSAACSQEWIEEFLVKQSLREAVDHYCSKIKTILAETNDYRQVAYTGDFERRMMELLTHILK